MHDDHLVIHAAPDSVHPRSHGPALPHADDIGPSLPLPLSALSSASAKKLGEAYGIVDVSAGHSTLGDLGKNASLLVRLGDEEPKKRLFRKSLLKRSPRPTVPQLLRNLGALQQATSTQSTEKINADVEQVDAPQQTSTAEELLSEETTGKEGVPRSHITIGSDDESRIADREADESEIHAEKHELGGAKGDEIAGGTEADPLFDSENPSRPCGKRHPVSVLHQYCP